MPTAFHFQGQCQVETIIEFKHIIRSSKIQPSFNIPNPNDDKAPIIIVSHHEYVTSLITV